MKKAARSKPKLQTKTATTVYAYVQPANKKFASSQRKNFGTASKYIDFLISKDRGLNPKRPTFHASR